MGARKLSVAAVVVALGAVSLSGAAGSASAAHSAASTRVTIYSWTGGLFGYVSSTRTNSCANNRQVSIFKQRGNSPKLRGDRLIGIATARRNHGSYQWSRRSPGSGRFYARPANKAGCGTSSSRTVSGARTGLGDPPPCPSTAEACNFYLHVDMPICPAFSAPVAVCFGKATGTPAWAEPVLDPPGAYAGFNWGRLQDGRYQIQYSGFVVVPISNLMGTIPGPRYADFTVTVANSAKWGNPGIQFFTPDIPGRGPGKEGGPLYLNFDNGIVGADVYINGYLFRR